MQVYCRARDLGSSTQGSSGAWAGGGAAVAAGTAGSDGCRARTLRCGRGLARCLRGGA